MDPTSLNKGIKILNEAAKLRVSSDCMAVKVYPLTDGFNLSRLKEIGEVLRELGIQADILTTPEQQADCWVVARGTPPVNGDDGRIELLTGRKNEVSEKDNLEKSDVDRAEVDTVDPRELNIIVNAVRGQRVAKKIPPGKGTPGRDVFGMEIPPVPGKWAVASPGQGVKSVENDTCYVATVSGKVHVENGEISILEEWEINGNVDISTGHVNFYGKLLTIKGSVHGGFRVSVRGDLIIEGNVEDEALVEAGGDLVVKGLIRAGNTVVKSGGSMKCTAVEYAEVKAGKDVEVDDYLLDATCMAGGDVSVMSGKGLVAGGRVLLGGSFSAKITGTPANVPTMIHAGFNPGIKETHDGFVKELEDFAAKRTELKKALGKIEIMEKKQGLSAKMATLKGEIIKGLSDIEKATLERRKTVEELEAHIGRLRAAAIEVHGRAYPNSIIRVANASLALKKEVESVLFRFRKGQVVLTTL